MEIFNYFSEHQAHLFYLIAGISFIIELTVLGMSGPLLFIAIASVITGVLIQFGFLETLEGQFLTLGLLTAIVALVLWKPMKRFQNTSDGMDNSSDMIGKKVPASCDITPEQGKIRYSGIDWNAKLISNSHIDVIPAKSFCVICQVEGNVMIVKPV